MDEAKGTLAVTDWENFRSFRCALNHAPIEMIAAIEENQWRNGLILGGEEYRRTYESIPEETRKKIQKAYAMKMLEGLNGVFRWMESQISQGEICLETMEKR